MLNPYNLTMCLYMIILKILSSLVCNFSYQQDLLKISKYNCSFKLFCKLIPIREFIIPVGICLYVTDSFNTLAGTSPSLEQLLPFSYLLILSSETGSNLLTRLQNCLRWFFLRCWCDVYSKCLCHLSCSVDWWFQCCSLAVWY